MNNEFKNWQDDVNKKTVDASIFNQIDRLSRKKSTLSYVRRSLIILGMAFVLFASAVNLSPSFYAFAQESFLRDVADILKITNNAMEDAIDKKQYQLLDMEFNGVKLEYLVMEGRQVTVIYSGNADVKVKIDGSFIYAWDGNDLGKGLKYSYSSGLENLDNNTKVSILVDGKELVVPLDISKKLETKVVEVNKEFTIDEGLSYKITKIEMGQFVTDVYVEYPKNIYVSFHDLSLNQKDGRRISHHLSMTATGILENDPIVYSIGVGTQTVSKDAKLVMGELSWNDDTSLKGTLDLETGEVTNLNPALTFVEFRDTEDEDYDKYAVFSHRKNLGRIVSNPIMFESINSQSWTFKDDNGLTYYELSVPKDIDNGKATFINNWGLYTNSNQYEVELD